ncbi:claudin-18 [Clupea harengus]|uniref:Claudin n=1 Tax=Clupea harengus TaxID=7950 RepID=A0A6P3VU31_CLUHA|nr:claudin-18 [Clupea harengus]
MASTMLQTGGFVLGILGIVALIAAVGMNNWSSQDRQGDVVTSVYTYKGLWRNCEVTTAGLTECRPFYGLLGYSGSFQAVRALMIVGIVMGVISALLGLFSLKCFKMGSMEDSPRAKMTLTAGIMFIVAGICGIAGASIYANQIVASYMRTMYNPNYGGNEGIGGMGGGGFGGNSIPRYTFGPALFVAWIGGALVLLGGILDCVAYKGLVPEKSSYGAVAYKAPSHSNATSVHTVKEEGRRDQKYV